MKYNLIFFLFFISCSFKPQDPQPTQGKSDENQVHLLMDSDGDGVSDKEELENGSNPYIAEIPHFEGELFNEMSVEVEFYNKTSRDTKTIDWKISDGKVASSDKDISGETLAGSPYMDTLLRNYASSVDFKKSEFKFYDYNEGIFSYSSPILPEETILTISDKTLFLVKNGYDIHRSVLLIKSKFKIKSTKYTHLRNISFDFFYKSKNRDGLIYIETKKIDGTYSFNEENEIFIHFENFNPKIINEAILSGSSNLFLKIRDFTIYETDERYSSILERVQSRSVPVTLSYPKNDELRLSVFDTLYIGTNGGKEKLGEILKKAFNSDILMTDRSIDQVRGLSNRERSFGDSGGNEILRWYIGSSEIGSSIYTHSFSPGVGIALSYLSDKKTRKTPSHVSRGSFGTHSRFGTGVVALGAKDLKIRFKSNKILIPTEKLSYFTRPDCGRGNWSVNQITYSKIDLTHKDDSVNIEGHLLSNSTLSVTSPKGTILSANLGELVREGIVEKILNEEPHILEFTFSSITKKEIFKNSSEIKIEFEIYPKLIPIRQGLVTKLSERCHREHPDHHTGGGGGRNVLKSFFSELDFQHTVKEEEVLYDLDFHIVSF